MTYHLEFFLLVFTSLFTVIDPVGLLPIYIAMTEHLEERHAKRVAYKAALTAFIVLLVFMLMGQLIFNFFNISINSLKVVGGVIFFVLGWDMLQARLSRTKKDDEDVTSYVEDIAVTPLAIPLITGPGAITVVILHWQEAQGMAMKSLMLAATFLVVLFTLLMLLGARRIMKVLGSSGNRVLMRLMGLIVMVIAVEFFFAGLKPILRGIFLVG